MTFSPTPEQISIIEAAQDSERNLLISALAGAAKTSTLVLIAKALPATQMLCLAFNKKIAMEMTDRLPANCTAMTLNSLGHRAWAAGTGRRLSLDKSKTYTILAELISKLPAGEQSVAFESFSDTMRMIDSGASAGWIPDEYKNHGKRLVSNDEFFSVLEEEPTILQEQLIIEATCERLRQAFQGKIDFNDQILMPTVYSGLFPRFPLVLVDEAQDLSALNHSMLRKIARKRLIAVGDACQAIYGFRGAHEDSMSKMRQEFDMQELGLTISFRCPRAVVAEARFRAPHMQWPEWAKEGEVRSLTTWTAEDVPDNSTIICRNNAPLFSMAIKLLNAKRYPELVGNDIGKALLKVLEKFGDHALPRSEVLESIRLWREAKLVKARDKSKVHDQAACLTVFANEGETLGDAIAYAKHIFSMAGPVKLMTGHKAKGLEFDEVFFLDEHLIGDRGQERNLRYVIITRAKQRLTYVTSEGWVDA